MAGLFFKLTLFLALGIQLTYAELTLSTGAFIKHKGKLNIVDNYLGLLLDFSHLNQFNDQFRELRDQLFQIKDTVPLASCNLVAPDFNRNIIAELTDELNKVIVNNRQKRAWPALMVSGLSALFGFTTQVQVLYLQNKLSDITKAQQNLHIELVQTKERLQETHTLVNRLQSETTNLKYLIANLTQHVELCLQNTQITSILINIKVDLEKSLNELKAYINSIIMVSDGKVTADILPLETLNRVLHNDTYNRKTNTIFPIESTHMYYPFLEAQLTTKGLLITLPLESSKTYEYYSFTPHPTCSDNESLILETERTELLVNTHTHSHFEESSITISKCPSHFGLTICNHIYINTVENNQDTCLYSLLNSKQSSPSCRFHSVSYRPESLPLLVRVGDVTLIHNPEVLPFKIFCQENISSVHKCDFTVPLNCGAKCDRKTLAPVPLRKISVPSKVKRRYVEIPKNLISGHEHFHNFYVSLYIILPVLILNILLGLFMLKRCFLLRQSLPKIIHTVA